MVQHATVLALLYALFAPTAVLAFSFSYSAPTQCGQLSLTWSGGTPPFAVLITPAFDVPRNISIPDSAFSNGKGNFSTQLTVESQKQFLLTMSDSTGFGTGGTSDLLTVGDPLSGAPSCDTASPSISFQFELNSALQQCRQYTFSGFTGAISPLTIYGLIPLGTTFALQVAPDATSYAWNANVKSGTRIVWTMTDGQGRSGGSSDVVQVGASDDSSCVNDQSPASTIAGSPSSVSSTSSATGTSEPSNGGTGKSSTGGIVAGAVVGGLVAIVVIGGLLWFCLKKRHQTRDTPHTSTAFPKREGSHGVDLHEPDAHLEAGHNYEPEPYVLPVSAGPPSSSHGHSDRTSYPPGHPAAGWGAGEQNAGTSTRTSKFSEAFSGRGQPPNTPARFVLHTDAGEVAEETGEDGVVELPPQYTSIGGARVARAPTYRERNAQGDASGSGSGGNATASSSGEANPPSTGPSSS